MRTRIGEILTAAQRKLVSRSGQTFILVMTVTAMAAVLGAMAMSSSLMSLRLRGMKRVSEKNFYRLELALGEITAGAARDLVEATVSARAENWQASFLSDRVGIHDLAALMEENATLMNSRRETARRNAASWLMSMSATIPASSDRMAESRSEELEVTVGDILLDSAACIVLTDVHFVLVNYERDAQTEIICDLILRAPAAGAASFDEVLRVENWRRIG